MTLTDITIPADQAEGTTSTVATWFKRVGDPVREHEPLLELSTDKVTVEIAAPAGGVLQEILASVGDLVHPGQVVGRIGAEGDARSEKREGEPGGQGGQDRQEDGGVAASVGAGPARRERAEARHDAEPPPLSPAVRRLLKEHGLDAAQVTGTGRDGRITAEDVERVAAGGQADEADRRTGGQADKADGQTGGQVDRAAPSPGASRRVPHTQMRKSIAAHMVQSVATAPHVTTVFDADLTKVIRHRERNRSEAEARGFKLTYTAYFVQATVRALQAVPEVNSRWHDDALELFEDCNIGVGTALEDGGLIVPVIRQAQTLDLLQTAERLHDLTTRARAGKLTPADVQGGTFTISNHGVSGSIIAAPIIINQPQSAILGVGRLEKRVVVAEAYGHVVPEIRPMLYVTLTIDHRVLDGFQANKFLTEWVRVVEGWE